MEKQKVLFFGRRSIIYRPLISFMEFMFDTEVILGDWGEKFPYYRFGMPDPHTGAISVHDLYREREYDWVISWLCPWKIPEKILNKAKKGAINFHPGPPKYPGIGCYNYAIWNQDKEYAVTCHMMDGKIDQGKILKVWSCQIYPNDTVETLKHRAINTLVNLFYDIMNDILVNKELYEGPYKWGKYKSRKDFQDFNNINTLLPIFDEALVERRVRAAYFPNAADPPTLTLNGKKWRLEPL